MWGSQRTRQPLAGGQRRRSRAWLAAVLTWVIAGVVLPVGAVAASPLSLTDTLPAAMIARPVVAVGVLLALLAVAAGVRRIEPSDRVRAVLLAGTALLAVAVAGWNVSALVGATAGSAITRALVLGTIRGLALLFGLLWIALNLYNFYPLVRTGVGRAVGNVTGRYRVGTDDHGDTGGPRADGGDPPGIDPHDGVELPEIDLLLPAYNEAEVIAESLRSIRGADYPEERLNVYVLLEASDRETPQVLPALAAEYEFTR